MNGNIMDISEQTRWLNAKCPDGGLLQSEEWRQLNDREGLITRHFENDELWANVIEYALPIAGKYWYLPRGPVLELPISDSQQRCWRDILREAQKNALGWIRMELKNEEELSRVGEWSKEFSMRKAPHDMQPREILVADISGSEEDLFANMKPKTRYNIRLAERHGVEVFSGRDEGVLREFLRMNQEMARRNRISTHADQHYRMLPDSFPSDQIELLVAKRGGRYLAAILVVFFGDTATYLHGASSDDERSLMAPYLLQWRAIEMARRRGCMRYDFGGVDTSGLAPSLSGVTRFKQGFARNVNAIRYPGSYDIVLIPSRYSLYKAMSMSKYIVNKAKRVLTKQ